MRVLFATFVLFAALIAPARAESIMPVVAIEGRYLVFVTIDGYRWQELFRGADPSLVADPGYRARYVDVPNRAQALTPFLLSFAREGVLIGNRDENSCARVSNDFWFSYPGYAEMLAGRPNPRVRYNAAVPNDDITVLERLSQRYSVRVFAEWDVVRAILNVDRSGLAVFVTPNPDERHDPQVIPEARAALADPPDILWVALGDTDNRAHEGKYEEYLAAATEADNFVREIWEAYQANPRTAGRTTLIVTADHGRGPAENDRWTGHGSGRWRGIRVPGLYHEGSDAIFIAARGPNIVAAPVYNMDNCASVSQIAATMIAVFGEDDLVQPDMAPPLAIFAN